MRKKWGFVPGNAVGNRLRRCSIFSVSSKGAHAKTLPISKTNGSAALFGCWFGGLCCRSRLAASAAWTSAACNSRGTAPFAKVHGRKLSLSISHAGPFVLGMADDTPCGVDTEEIRTDRNWMPIAKSFSRAGDSGIACWVGFRCTNGFFYRFWTMKEAYLKYRGTGLQKALSSFGLIFVEKMPACRRWTEQIPAVCCAGVFIMLETGALWYRKVVCRKWKPFLTRRW